MAYDVEKLIKLKALKALSEKLKGEISAVKTSADTAFKSAKVDGNTVSFYTSADQTGTAAFTMDFPVEMFLDQAKTKFEGNFAWTEAAYPGSTNPNLDGKPVMVLAVKGSDDSCTYSFLGMAALVDTYTAKTTGKDPSTTVTVDGYEIDVKVNISKEADNQAQIKDDGIYVPPTKVAGATDGNFAGLDANGQLTDSGKSASDFSKVEASTTAGAITVDGTDVTVVDIATDEEFTEMLNEVFPATAAT